MRLPRFFVPHATGTGTSVDLPSEEAAHLTRVLRLGAGAAIAVFDGRGQEWHATVDAASRTQVRATLHTAVVPAPEPRLRLTLAAAVLKGDKMDDVVRDAVMLGASAVQPLVTARTETSIARLDAAQRVTRWQRVAVASAKQCGRAVVPPILPVSGLADALARGGARVMLVEPGDLLPAPIADVPVPDHEAALLVGPEGGWSEAEVRHAQASGAFLVTLGGQTLRADAMAVVALTALRVRWGDF